MVMSVLILEHIYFLYIYHVISCCLATEVDCLTWIHTSSAFLQEIIFSSDKRNFCRVLFAIMSCRIFEAARFFNLVSVDILLLQRPAGVVQSRFGQQ